MTINLIVINNNNLGVLDAWYCIAISDDFVVCLANVNLIDMSLKTFYFIYIHTPKNSSRLGASHLKYFDVDQLSFKPHLQSITIWILFTLFESNYEDNVGETAQHK